jgi:DNA-binding CsgD family transcriptional regulator
MTRDLEARAQSLFCMTAKEAALAARIAEGLPLKEGARLQGIRFSAARSYLESVFHKAGRPSAERTRRHSQDRAGTPKGEDRRPGGAEFQRVRLWSRVFWPGLS